MHYDLIAGRKNVMLKDTFDGNGVRLSILEYTKDESCTTAAEAQINYYMERANMRLKQIAIELDNGSVAIEAGAMSYMLGNIEAKTNVKGLGDLLGKAISSSLTGEKAIKPVYSGSGLLVLEPTYKHFLTLNMNNEDIIVDDGMFMAADSSIKTYAAPMKNISSMFAGNEGFFQLGLRGSGVVALESLAPISEIQKFRLQNDTLKVDGNFVVLRSASLNFSVQRTTKTLLGSAASGEGLVNVYSGTGEVWLAPLLGKKSIFSTIASNPAK